MRVHQLVHTLNYGDAISNEALTLRSIFDRQSCGGRIFSLHAHEKVWDAHTPLRHFASETAPGDTLLLHYSIASPLNELFCSAKGFRRMALYHNITPPRWFERYNARVVKDLIAAREDLPHILASDVELLADSSYNASELEQLGGRNISVLPLPFDEAKWEVAANPGILSILRGHGGRNILHVGRIAPNKCIEDIIKIFYFYHQKIDPQSRLWLVGSDVDTEIYSFELRRLVSELRLKEAVTFVGSVADSELKAFYQASDVYVCMSEHEGFCVPLLEAMHFGLPILAFDSCAVKETLGPAGVLCTEKEPALLAELLSILVSDGDVRARLIAAGRKRAEDFGLQTFSHLVERILIERRGVREAVAC